MGQLEIDFLRPPAEVPPSQALSPSTVGAPSYCSCSSLVHVCGLLHCIFHCFSFSFSFANSYFRGTTQLLLGQTKHCELDTLDLVEAVISYHFSYVLSLNRMTYFQCKNVESLRKWRNRRFWGKTDLKVQISSSVFANTTLLVSMPPTTTIILVSWRWKFLASDPKNFLTLYYFSL